MNIKAKVQEQFGANAAAYATSKVHAKGASLARLVELVEPQPEWQVLDVATAAGHTAFAFAPHVAQVTASDLTPEMLPVAARLAAEKGISNVVFELADAEELPFADASFDLVTCRIAPHHFSDIDRFLAQSARVLADGGLLAVVDNVVPGSDLPGDEGDQLRAAGRYVNDFEKLRDPSHNRALSLAEWTAAFQRVGFELLQVESAGKEMEFDPWATRMGATPETIARLRDLLVDAPPAAADYFQVRTEGEALFFYLTEAIVIGRRGGGGES